MLDKAQKVWYNKEKIRKGEMKMDKILVFDMDGTIADFYGVKGWLDYLEKSDETPYLVASPLYDMNRLNAILNMLKVYGWHIAVTSWLAKGSDKDFDEKVRQAKKEWWAQYGFPYDSIHLVKYGTTKANCTRKLGGYQILVDDNEKVRKGWNLGSTINANSDIITELIKILKDEM